MWAHLGDLNGLSALDDVENTDADDSFLVEKRQKRSSISSFLRGRDLNNDEDDPLVNKPKRAVEIGLKIDF